MKEEKFRKSDKEKEILIPERFPPLRKERKPFLLDKLKSKSNFNKMLVHAKNYYIKKEGSLFKLLFKDSINFVSAFDCDKVNKRSLYLKEVLLSNESFFPHELKLDKLPKKNHSKKSNYLEQLAKDKHNLLNHKRKNENKIEENKKPAGEVKNNSANKGKQKGNIIEDIETEYLNKKNSLYYEKYRRDSLDMTEYRINALKEQNKLPNNDKIIQDDETVNEENKSEEESFNNDEYGDESGEGEQYNSDDNDMGDGGYSDY